LLDAVGRVKKRVLWTIDPMHGNTLKTGSGRKTRRFDDILLEIERTFIAHDQAGTFPAGVHFELTGENVKECLGGADGVTEDELDDRYATACDPRLNYRQALEMSFFIANHLKKRRSTK
jgi:3-deoxy-7-phosphoheptulonate synthase